MCESERMNDELPKIEKSRCAECGKHFFFADDARTHRCKPQWNVWEDEQTREWGRTVRASDAQAAAEEWAAAEDWDGAEFAIVGQRREPTVNVAAVGSDDVQRFVVSGEAVPEYTAREIK